MSQKDKNYLFPYFFTSNIVLCLKLLLNYKYSLKKNRAVDVSFQLEIHHCVKVIIILLSYICWGSAWYLKVAFKDLHDKGSSTYFEGYSNLSEILPFFNSYSKKGLLVRHN